MKSLAERQAERIQRKADNKAFSNAGNVSGGVGAAALAFDNFKDAISGLSDAEKDELKEVLRDSGDPFTADRDVYGDAFDDEGNLRTAGVGVANPLIAPVSAQQAVEEEAGVSKGWGDFVAEPKVDPAKGNEAGQALDEATGAAGNGGGAGEGAGWSAGGSSEAGEGAGGSGEAPSGSGGAAKPAGKGKAASAAS